MEDYVAAGRAPALSFKLTVAQTCAGCKHQLYISLLPDGGRVVGPECGTRYTGPANLNEPLPLGEIAGLSGIRLPDGMEHLSLGQVLTMFEDRVNQEYETIFQLLQTGGATLIQGKVGDTPSA